jgi:ribosomal protein S18 acetylase RimI-like enzyme
MLLPLNDIDQFVANKAELSLEWRVLGHWLRAPGTPMAPVLWLADNPCDPQVVLRVQGSSCMALGDPGAAADALRWLSLNCERAGPEFELGRVNPRIREAALKAGLLDVPAEPQPHYSAHAWYIEGPPRFGYRVRHPCRVAQGVELLKLFLIVDEREDELYLRACLEQGPSYVCEVRGEAVCWSLTHLGGAMGRIFTPPQHRGCGFGKSLTAFQVDDTLRGCGIAVASVSVDNPASYRLLQALGAEHLPEELTWSHMLWPC